MEPNQPLTGVGKGPPQAKVESHPPQAKAERHPPPPCQSSKPASTGRGKKPTTSGGPVDPPLEREGAGNGVWTDWYQRTLQGAEGGTSEPQGPPYPIGTMPVRREAIGQIYNSVDGKDPPHAISPLKPCGPTTLELIPRH